MNNQWTPMQKELHKILMKLNPEVAQRERNAMFLTKFTDKEISKFTGQFMRKYSYIITGRQIKENLGDCMDLFYGKINIREFERKTQIALERTSLEEEYEIGL